MVNYPLRLAKSTISGTEVFADKNFENGEELLKYTGKLFTHEQLPIPYNEVEDHYVQIDKNLYMGTSGKLDDFVNHSCNPNSALKINNGKVILIAIRNIKKGEEITFDYSTTWMDQDDWEIDCKCGNEKCRKKIGNFRYLPRKIQQKYIKLGIVPTYILKKS